MDTSPWDYWGKDQKTPKPALAPAIAAVEKVMATHPNHAGANHLYIHLMEASLSPEKAEAAADRLATEAPLAGHLVHMPGHIYFRVGRYQDSLKANRNAVAVDETYLNGAGASDVYRYGYYPHNVHFLLASAAMAGDASTTLEAAEKLDRIIPTPVLEAVPWLSHPVKASYYFAEAQFGTPDEVMVIPSPPDVHPYLKAMWHYARGVAMAETGNGQSAMAEADAIAALVRTADLKIMTDNHMPAPDVMTLAELVLRGKAQAAMGDLDAALATMKEASAKQQSIAYMEPPYWYYPVEQSVGAILLRMNRPEEAKDAFNRSLIMHPNNAWSLYGLMKAQEQANDPAASATAELYRRASVAPDMAPPALERL
jgi:tetratricopeptide (TPR) repeat protein